MSEKEIVKVLEDYNELRRKIEKFVVHEWPDMGNPEVENIILRGDGVIEADIEYNDVDPGEIRHDTVTILLADFENFFENENK
jgi:hypothetical protein